MSACFNKNQYKLFIVLLPNQKPVRLQVTYVLISYFIVMSAGNP